MVAERDFNPDRLRNAFGPSRAVGFEIRSTTYGVAYFRQAHRKLVQHLATRPENRVRLGRSLACLPFVIVLHISQGLRNLLRHVISVRSVWVMFSVDDSYYSFFFMPGSPWFWGRRKTFWVHGMRAGIPGAPRRGAAGTPGVPGGARGGGGAAHDGGPGGPGARWPHGACGPLHPNCQIAFMWSQWVRRLFARLSRRRGSRIGETRPRCISYEANSCFP